MKKIYISIIWVIFIFLISCEINPFVGVGSTVDTIAPEVIRVTPANFSYVRDDFELIVTCYDNVLVTRAKLEIEKDNKKIFEKAESISAEKIAGYQTWKVPISLKDDLKIAKDEQGGEFKVIAYVYDERDNMSENSYKSVTIVVDVDTAEADIYSPELFKKAKCETLRNEEINPENFTIFQNSQFQISGECNDNSSIQSVHLTIRDENGETVKPISIDEAFKKKEKYVSGSLYNWKLSLSATESDDESIISLGEGDSPADTRFYEVFLQVKDSAGNVTFTEGNGYDETLGKSFGWFAVRQTADYPFSDFSSISDKVSVNSLLTGKSYDDDGIAEIKIYHKPLETEEWELIKSYSKDGSKADESLEGTPQIFTWELLLPENATSSNYQLKVEVIDIYGKSNIEGYKEQYLSQDKILCSFGIVDPTAPSIEPIDLTDFKRVVDKDGNFDITVKASDNSMVKKIYVAWKPESTEESPNWSEFAAKASTDPYKDEETGIKYWDISPETGAKEAEKELKLNIYDDFENTYEKKVFYVYAEDDSGKSTEITTSMPKFTEMPEVTITSPAPGAVETTFNNQKFAIEVEIYSYMKEMKTIEISCDANSFDDVNGLTSHYDESRKLWKHTCIISSADWQWDGEEAASYSLTAKVTDVFDNSNSDMLSFDIDNGVPRIKSVNAETAPGSYCAGSEIKIFVEMRKEVSVTANKENLYLELSNGGTAYYDKAETERNASSDGKTKKIFFTYQVEQNHGSGAFNALELHLASGVKISDAVGNIEGKDDGFDGAIPIGPEIMNIAKNTSSMLIIDNEPPKIKSVTSITPNGSYTKGDEINLIVEFDEKVTVSGKPTLVLSENQTAEYEKTESDTKLYFTYKVEGGVNIEALEWEKITASEDRDGVIKDCAVDSGNEVNFSDLQCNDNTSLAASGRKIKIDNKAPVYKETVQNYTNEGLRFYITFDEPVYKVAGKKATLHRSAVAVPIVLSVDKYNEYVALVPGIASYYEKGVNGANSGFEIDNTTKYILKYDYDPTNNTLLGLFKDEKLGFYTQEIMMESNWVKNDGNSIVITIPPSSLLTGEQYWLTIEADFVEDKVGLSYSGEYSSESTEIQAGTKAQPPVIRIQKITGGTAKTTKMKINTITNGATIKYNRNGGTLSEGYNGEITLGADNYDSGIYKIKALAQINGGIESDYGYESAYKTVIYTSHGVKTPGDEVYFRGADVKSGSATVPNFPFSWDEASSPEKWDNDREKKAAEVGMIKAAHLSGNSYYVVSWGVTNTLYFKPLSCKNYNGKFVWAWGLGNCAEVQPGFSSDSNDNGKGIAYETNYHDKSGANL